jgi:hypothetical protein
MVMPKIQVKTPNQFINAKIKEFETVALYKKNMFYII